MKSKMLRIALAIMENVFKASKRIKMFHMFRLTLAPIFMRLFGYEYLRRHIELYEKYYIDKLKKFLGDVNGVVLDVSCGAGVLTKAFSGVGVDICKYPQWKEGIFILANAHCLPFRDKSFDLVILANILEHVENPKRVIDKAKRVCRDRIYVSFPTKYSLSALYHILFGSQANFKGVLDYKSVKKWFELEFEIERERERFLPIHLKNNFSNPEIVFKRRC
jgi:ubiquinone/menaquinone biosynthesis C-methylase UbiE